MNIIYALQQQTLSVAATTPGHTLDASGARKMATHAEACKAIGVLFVPLVYESLGGWSNEAIRTVRAIGRHQGQHLGIPLSESIQHLVIFQSLAISLWKGYATLWIHHQLTYPVAVDGLI